MTNFYTEAINLILDRLDRIAEAVEALAPDEDDEGYQ